MQLDISKNMCFKRRSDANWEPWFYLHPSIRTLEILSREVKANGGKNTIFYGEPVVAFKFLDNTEVDLNG
jgi:hypothetical protein